MSNETNDNQLPPQPAQSQAAQQPGRGQQAEGAQPSQPQPQPQTPQGQQPPQPASPQGQQPTPPQPAATPRPDAAAAPRPVKSRGWIVAIVAIVAAFALCALGIGSCTTVLSSATGSLSGSVAQTETSTDSVGVITISGTIEYDGTSASPEGLKAQLDRAAENDHIKAVVLRVNSGGGTATAGEEMATYVKQFREETGKPVVVSSAATNASAAYEVSSQADFIFTAKTTAIGAIGTAMQITDVSELLDKLGIAVDNVTSSSSKDSTYGTRALTDDERAYYQDMVDKINATFIENVASGRNMDVEAVRALATGLTFTGTDAVENGLADEIGTKEDAVAKAAELAGMKRYDTVSLQSDSGSVSDLLDLLSKDNSSVSAADVAAALKEIASNGNNAN